MVKVTIHLGLHKGGGPTEDEGSITPHQQHAQSLEQVADSFHLLAPRVQGFSQPVRAVDNLG